MQNLNKKRKENTFDRWTVGRWAWEQRNQVQWGENILGEINRIVEEAFQGRGGNLVQWKLPEIYEGDLNEVSK